MNIIAIKTAESEAAVNRIKKSTTRKFDLGVSLEVPKEFLEKRNYMQSDEFLKDSHNSTMLFYIDELMKYRNEIAKEINEMNKTLKNKFVQGINGFARLKDEIEKNYSLNFDNELTINTNANKKYKVIRDILSPFKSKNLK